VSIAPILLLAAANIEQIDFDELWLPLSATVVLASITWGIWWLLIRNMEKAALLTSLSMMIFLVHGLIHHAISLTSVTPRSRILHLALLLCWFLVISAAYLGLVSRKRSTYLLTKLVTTIAAIVVVMGIVQLSTGYFRARAVANTIPLRDSVFPPSQLDVSQRKYPNLNSDLPDIYYLVLDGYARQDQLTKICGYDNTDFLQFLRNKGFYVANQSHSNYGSTFLSLASSMNLRYLDSEAQSISSQSLERGPVYEMIRNNDVARYLQVKGYRIVHLNTWWGATARSDIADDASPFTLSEFQMVFLKTTMLEPIVWRLSLGRGPELLLHHFKTLKEIPKVDVPTFTFAHIICPHPPYVFDREGICDRKIPNDWKNHEEDYIDQLIYLNHQVQEIVETILAQSTRRPIIILQADHGSAFLKDDDLPFEEQPDFIQERMSILNAYYVPDSCRDQLYESITPVNTFRVLLNSLFDEQLLRLPDRILFSWYSSPYDFIDVTRNLIPLDKGSTADDEEDASTDAQSEATSSSLTRPPNDE